MSASTYIIETCKGAAGIVVRDGRGFRFFAAKREFHLDGQLFATPRAAEAAAVECLSAANGRARKTPERVPHPASHKSSNSAVDR
jgi:hypothetical protein